MIPMFSKSRLEVISSLVPQPPAYKISHLTFRLQKICFDPTRNLQVFIDTSRRYSPTKKLPLRNSPLDLAPLHLIYRRQDESDT